MTWSSKEIHLAKRPTGFPGDETWSVVTTDLPDPTDGEFVVQVDHISLDPAMRGWLNDVRSYVPPVGIGEPMRALCTATVVSSRHPDFKVGDAVSGIFGVVEYSVSDGAGVTRLDLGVASAPTWLGALGMPGMTAYFGLNDVGRIKEGETVVVSAAAGAVGSVVCQLAVAKGCRVIGIAGGEDKVAWLREIGVDEAIDYKSENVLRRLREVAPNGIDVYFDNVGGEILDAALANLRRGARIVLCGAIASYNDASLAQGPRRYMSLLVFRASMTGFVVFDYEDRYPEAVSAISDLIADGRLVARETLIEGGVEAFPQALLGLYDGVNTGKLVLKA
jgi:NADPH-dependent curcumin reductase CurA